MKAALLTVAVFAGCKTETSPKCGAGTTLKDGVCEVAPGVAVATTDAAVPSPSISLVSIDAGAVDAGVTTKWEYQEKKDEMRGGAVRFASLLSDNATDFGAPYGQAKLEIVLRKGDAASQAGLDAFMVIRDGQFDCSMDGCFITYKFDDEKPARLFVNEGKTSDSLFFLKPSSLVERLKKSKRLMIEAEFYSQGRRQFSFSTSGLDFEIAEKATKAVPSATQQYVDPNARPKKPTSVKDVVDVIE